MKKVKGGTILEALVAMIIIVVCTGIAATIFVNVMDGQNNRLKISAATALEEIAEQSKKERKFIDEKIEGEFFTIDKKTEKYPGADKISLFSLRAIDKKGNLLAERTEFVIE